MFRVNRDVWMISSISEEWEDTSGSTRSIVVRELCEQWKFRPVVLLVVIIKILL